MHALGRPASNNVESGARECDAPMHSPLQLQQQLQRQSLHEHAGSMVRYS